MPFKLGSPPRMRGKDSRGGLILKDDGITPAYAGKREMPPTGAARTRDHPRVCGEKVVCLIPMCHCMGSPPRVRGKGCGFSGFFDLLGITPACAGKSMYRTTETPWSRDHPRVCGEKGPAMLYLLCSSGSPPRVRGKERQRVKRE